MRTRSRLVWLMAACFSLTLLMSARMATQTADDCQARVWRIMVGGVPNYWLFCEGTCISEECELGGDMSGSWCMCGSHQPYNADCRGYFFWNGPGSHGNYANFTCSSSGCWTACNKVPAAEVPEDPEGVQMCKCPPLPPIE